jgi:hypothetical protein
MAFFSDLTEAHVSFILSYVIHFHVLIVDKNPQNLILKELIS